MFLLLRTKPEPFPGPQAPAVRKEEAGVRRGEGEADGGAKGRDARPPGKLPGRKTKGVTTRTG